MSRTTPDQQNKDLALALVDEFGAVMPAFGRWIRSRTKGSEVSHARMKVLWVLHCDGPQIMSDLSEKLGVSPRNITTLVDALERDGMVRRLPHPTDRRATVIELVPRGTEGWAKAYSGYRRAASELFAELSEADQVELIRLLGALRSVLKEKGIAVEYPSRATKTSASS